MSVPITPGCVLSIFKGSTPAAPVVQIINIKKIGATNAPNAPSSPDRYRLVISDGDFYQQAMLATQLNHLIEQEQMANFSFIRLDEYLCNQVNNRKIVIILQVSVVSKSSEPYKQPQNVETAGQQAQAQPQAQMPAAAPMGAPNQAPASNYGGMNTGSNTSSFGAMKRENPVAGGGMGSNYSNMLQRAPANEVYHPISSLNPYQNRWTIKARVTSKGDIRRWNNQRGEGKLFSVDLLDSHGGQIRATMFGDAADKFFPLLQQGKVYTISRGQLKIANKKWNTLPNDYELTLNSDAEIKYVDDDASIEAVKFDIVPIGALPDHKVGDVVDVLGVVTQVSPISTIVSSKTQKEMNKRTINMMDQSGAQVEVTLWGQEAEKLNEDTLANNPVLGIKGVKISDYGGVSLSTSFQAQCHISPDRAEAHRLRAWYDGVGRTTQPRNLSGNAPGGGSSSSGANAPRKTLDDIKEEKLGFSDKPDFFSTKGTITFFKNDMERPPWYKACPKPDCKKKVTEDANGMYTCVKCDKSYPNFEAKYILPILVSDSTGSQWVSAFNETAEKLLGTPAQAMQEFVDQGNQQAFDEVFKRANFKTYLFRCRAKAENVQDELRVKVSVDSAAPINFKTENQYLLQQIATMV